MKSFGVKVFLSTALLWLQLPSTVHSEVKPYLARPSMFVWLPNASPLLKDVLVETVNSFMSLRIELEQEHPNLFQLSEHTKHVVTNIMQILELSYEDCAWIDDFANKTEKELNSDKNKDLSFKTPVLALIEAVRVFAMAVHDSRQIGAEFTDETEEKIYNATKNISTSTMDIAIQVFASKDFMEKVTEYFRVRLVYEGADIYTYSKHKQLVPSTSCASEWLPFKGSCYWVGRTTQNLSQSQDDCQELGAKLFTPNSQEELTFFNRIVPEGRLYYLGAQSKDSKLRWSTTTTFNMVNQIVGFDWFGKSVLGWPGVKAWNWNMTYTWIASDMAHGFVCEYNRSDTEPYRNIFI